MISISFRRRLLGAISVGALVVAAAANAADPSSLVAKTQPAGDNSTKVATTAFVQSQISASRAWALSYPGLNTMLDGVAVRIGGFLQAWEFGNGGNFSTTGIVGAVSTPSGTYTGTTPYYPDMGVAGYASTQTTTKSAVGVFGYGGAQIAGASIFGGNTIAVNCNLSASGCAIDGGLDFAFMASNEADVNVFSKSGGVAPSGSASGFSAVFGGNVQPTGDLTGFRVNSATSTHWKFGFRSENGSADAGMKIGAAATSGPAASQPFQQAALDGASAELLASAIVNSAGDWVFMPPSGVALSLNAAGTLAYSGPISAPAASGFYLGATQALLSSSGFIIVSNDTSPGALLNHTTSYLNADTWVIRDNAQTTTFATFTAAAATFSAGITAAALPASAGAGGLYVCVDSAGAFYKKASCP